MITNKVINKESAIIMTIMLASEMLLRDVEHKLNANGKHLKREPKMLLNLLFKKCRDMHSLYDRLLEFAIKTGQSDEDTPVCDAILNDANMFLRLIMMIENVLHHDDGDRELKLESTLKMMAKDPIFDQDMIDRLTNFK